MSSESSVLSSFPGGPLTTFTTSNDAASETSISTTTEATVTSTSTSDENSQQTQTSESNTKTETTNASFSDSTPPLSTVSDTASTPSPPITGLSSNDESSSTSINTSITDSVTVVPTDVSSSAPTSPASPTSVEGTDADSSTLPPTTAQPTNGLPADPTMESTSSDPTSPPTETITAPPTTDPTTVSEESTSAPPTDPTVPPTDPTTGLPTDPTTAPTGPTTVPTDLTTVPPTTVSPTDPTTAPTDPTIVPPTDPTTVPPTDPTTVPPTDPTTAPTDPTTPPTDPTTVPLTDPTTAPTDPTTTPTDPTTTLPTDPTAVPSTDSTAVPPTTVPTNPTTTLTDPTTAPPTGPTTEPTDPTSISSTDSASVKTVTAPPSNPTNAPPTTELATSTITSTANQETTSATGGKISAPGSTGTASTVISVSAASPASGAVISGTLIVPSFSGNRQGATLTVSGSGERETIDPHTEANESDLNVFTQSAFVKPEPLTLSSRSIITYVTTEFTTATNPDGSVTVIPTKTSTVVRTIAPTYSIQPNEFERNKGPVIGLSIVAAILALIAIGIGIWVCRRRRRQVAGRRYNRSPVGDIVTGPVLIRGHSVPADRTLASREWRPPLVTEFGEEDHGDDLGMYAGQTPMDATMSEREGFGPGIPTSLMRANSYGSAEEGTRVPLDIEISSSSRDTDVSSRDTMQFTTSLLSFDTDVPVTPQIATSRFSDTSSSQSVARTASLISLSAEPTPLDGQFSMSSLSIPESSGTIPVISPFADSFSTEAARNSYWRNSGQSNTSSMSSHDSGQPIRFSSDKQSGWREVEMEDAPSRMRGGRASTQDVVFQASNPFDDQNTPSLMSQISLISAQSPRNSTSSLLNPPLRPQWTGTLSDLGQRSGPSKAPSLPPIPAVASPALTDDSFHAEGLLADPAYAQSRGGGLNIPQRPGLEAQDSFRSLLDHVDYSMPITSNMNPFDDEITFSKLSQSEESSMRSITPGPQPPNDFLNDVRPVLSVLQKRAQTSREALQSPGL